MGALGAVVADRRAVEIVVLRAVRGALPVVKLPHQDRAVDAVVLVLGTAVARAVEGATPGVKEVVIRGVQGALEIVLAGAIQGALLVMGAVVAENLAPTIADRRAVVRA